MHTIRAGNTRIKYNSDFSGNAEIMRCQDDEGVDAVIIPAADFIEIIKAAMLSNSAFAHQVRLAIMESLKKSGEIAG